MIDLNVLRPRLPRLLLQQVVLAVLLAGMVGANMGCKKIRDYNYPKITYKYDLVDKQKCAVPKINAAFDGGMSACYDDGRVSRACVRARCVCDVWCALCLSVIHEYRLFTWLRLLRGRTLFFYMATDYGRSL